MSTIETKNLTKAFDGVMAINRLSVSFKPGKITGVIGPNGSGKTTLINVLTGLLTLDSGAVVVRETKLEKVRPYDMPRYGITRTFQNIRLFEQLPVLDNILVVLTERNVFSALFERHKEYHLKIAETALKKVGLWEKRGELAVNLSYGQRKLLEIARALATDADTYLFDEPFAGLFPKMVGIVSSILKELRQEGKTVVLVEHNMELIREISDRVIVMDAGQLLAAGESGRVLAQKEVIEAYLGE